MKTLLTTCMLFTALLAGAQSQEKKGTVQRSASILVYHPDTCEWLFYQSASLVADTQSVVDTLSYELQPGDSIVVRFGILDDFGFYGVDFSDTTENPFAVQLIYGEPVYKHRISYVGVYELSLNFKDSALLSFSFDLNTAPTSYVRLVRSENFLPETGTPEITEAVTEMQVFPNPFENALWIRFPDKQAVACTLLDVSGQLVKNWHAAGTYQLDTEALPPGVYFLKTVTWDGAEKMTRVVRK